MIFATNHQFMLDSALWRRFDSIVQFTLPKEQDRLLMLRIFFRAFGDIDHQLAALARATDGASGSDIEWLATEIMRRLLLDGRRQVEKRDMDDALAGYRFRMETGSNGGSSIQPETQSQGQGKPIHEAWHVIGNISPCLNMASHLSAASARRSDLLPLVIAARTVPG